MHTWQLFKIPNAGSVGSFFLIDSIWMRAGVLAIPSLHHKCHHQLHMVWGYSKLHFLSGYFYWLAWCGLLVHIDLPLVGHQPKTLSLSTSVEPPIQWNQRKQKDITGWLIWSLGWFLCLLPRYNEIARHAFEILDEGGKPVSAQGSGKVKAPGTLRSKSSTPIERWVVVCLCSN